MSTKKVFSLSDTSLPPVRRKRRRRRRRKRKKRKKKKEVLLERVGKASAWIAQKKMRQLWRKKPLRRRET